MPAWIRGGNRKLLERENLAVRATERSVAFGRNSINSPITIGVDEERIRQNLRDEIPGLAEVKGLPEAPLRAVLEKLSRNHVSEKIPTRLAAAADELIRLRADLTRLRDNRPEFAAICARVSALIDKGELDAAARHFAGWARGRSRAEERVQPVGGWISC